MLWSTYIFLPHSSNNVLIMRCMKGTDLRDLQSTVFIWWIWMRNRWEDLAVFKLAAMHLWKWSAVLIDILWQATLPGCWYKSPADSAVSRPLLYWLSHWSSLWSTKGKETCKQAHARTHTHTHEHVCNHGRLITFSHWLSHLCIYLSLRSHEIHKHVKAETHCSVRGYTQPEATTHDTKLYSAGALTSVLYVCTSWGLALMSCM